ncbi:MAG: VOC family protein [bacterium]|nr:VOC family protein [bacterium]
MKLKNVLIVVNDMDRAIRFYRDLFGLQVILDQDGNVIMSEGLVLQDAKIWKEFLHQELTPKNHMTELYFEESDLEGFVKRLEASEYEIEYVNQMMTHSRGQKVVRFYDPDGNLIEVGTPVN